MGRLPAPLRPPPSAPPRLAPIGLPPLPASPEPAGRARHPLGFLAARPARLLPGFLLGVGLGVASDALHPALATTGMLAGLALVVTAAAMAARLLRPRPWNAALLAASLPAAILLPLLAAAQQGQPRGVIAARYPPLVALQVALFGAEDLPPLPAEQVRGMLAAPGVTPRLRPATTEEFLLNALLFRRQDAPLPAAQALAEALRRLPDPPPDALLAFEGLWAGGLASVREALAPVPALLAPRPRALLEALMLPEPATRLAALATLAAEAPDWPPVLLALLRARAAAAAAQGPTVAEAGRMAALLDALEAPAAREAIAAAVFDPEEPARLAEELATLGWVREVAARRMAVGVLAPPPNLPDLPLLLRLTPPEPWRAVQLRRGEAWEEVPQRRTDTAEGARDPVPTLRLPRPWRPAEFEFRWLDREGEASAPFSWRLDPVPAMREAAQRALVWQGPFALYLPGRVGPTRLNPLPIAAALRPGLSAVEWHTDRDPRVRRVELGIADAMVLSGGAPRGLVEFEVGGEARTLFLKAVYADGTRSPLQELPIR